MSIYLKFIFDRIDGLKVDSVKLIQAEHEWANRQIVDEFKAILPKVEIRIDKKSTKEHNCDLLVITYMDDFMREQLVNKELRLHLRSANANWVMLYGLGYRKIDIMPAKELLPYLNNCQSVFRHINLLRRLRLLSLVTRLYEWRILS